MGLDGFSMANLGLHKEFTSAQLASNAESLAKKGNEISIKDVEGLAKKQRIERKELDEDEEESEFLYYENEEEEEEENQNNKNKKSKKFDVKLNEDSQMIELIDTENNEIIESISPADLVKLVSKLNSTAGILVNKRI